MSCGSAASRAGRSSRVFAVATEQFFERPARLRKHHEELYDALVAFYNLTPPDEPEAEGEGSFMARRWGSGE